MAHQHRGGAALSNQRECLETVADSTAHSEMKRPAFDSLVGNVEGRSSFPDRHQVCPARTLYLKAWKRSSLENSQ